MTADTAITAALWATTGLLAAHWSWTLASATIRRHRRPR